MSLMEMNESLNTTEFQDALILVREFDAPIKRVFEAWSKAEVLAKWFGPEGFTVSRADIDLKVGGSYEIEIRSPDGSQIKHFGTYVEINEPNELIFTWELEDQDCKGSEGQSAQTLVSISFKRVGQGTEITLTHERLPNKDAYDGHEFGWKSSFDSLTALLSNK